MGQKVKRIENRKLLDHVKSQKCLIFGCRGFPVDPCHIRTRGSGGPDIIENLVPMCRSHHTEQGKLPWSEFLVRYPEVRSVLEAKGWEIGDKIFHPTVYSDRRFQDE